MLGTAVPYLLLENIDLPLLHVQHVLQVVYLSSLCALLLSHVLDLFGFFIQHSLLFFQTQSKSIHLRIQDLQTMDGTERRDKKSLE